MRYPSATASRIVHAEPLYGAQPPHLDPGLEAVGIQTALLIGGRVEHLVGGLGLGLELGIRLRLRPRLELGLGLRLGLGLGLGLGFGFGLRLGLGLGFGLGLVGRVEHLARPSWPRPRCGAAVLALLDQAPALRRAAAVDERDLVGRDAPHLHAVAVEHGTQQPLRVGHAAPWFGFGLG